MVFEGKSGALVWRVVADESLRDLQARVWSALDGLERNPVHAPERWVPLVSPAHPARRPGPCLGAPRRPAGSAG
jgi:hypothetical protein